MGATRERWIDNLKGIAIILVVLCHTIEGFSNSGIYIGRVLEKVDDIVTIFHMPLFMVLSGYTFSLAYVVKNHSHNDNSDTYVLKLEKWKNQILNLFILYFMHSILFFLVKMVGARWVNNELTVLDLLMLPFNHIDIFWYLYSLAIIYLAMWFLIKFENLHKVLVILFVCCLCFSGTYNSSFPLIKAIYYLFFSIMVFTFNVWEGII